MNTIPINVSLIPPRFICSPVSKTNVTMMVFDISLCMSNQLQTVPSSDIEKKFNSPSGRSFAHTT